MAKKKKHIFDDNEGRHRVEKGTGGGACLTGHLGKHANFKGKCSCNYRYQALEQAKIHSRIKGRLHSYKQILSQIKALNPNGIPTQGEKKESGFFFPQHYSTKIDAPEAYDWDIGGPYRNIKRNTLTIKATHNFTRETWPYWNNAHHLIPKGTLIAEIANEEIGQSLEKGLLTAKYNINHKINMLFLPMDKEVGKILKLPRHIQLKVGDDNEIVAESTNHPVYNKMVKIDLKKIIANYREVAKEKDCEDSDFELDKKKLEKLSKDLLNEILSWSEGRSLDSYAAEKLRSN